MIQVRTETENTSPIFIDPPAPVRAATPVPGPMSDPSQLVCCLGITGAEILIIKWNANFREIFTTKLVKAVFFFRG